MTMRLLGIGLRAVPSGGTSSRGSSALSAASACREARRPRKLWVRLPLRVASRGKRYSPGSAESLSQTGEHHEVGA